jgi:hypothetical protein
MCPSEAFKLCATTLPHRLLRGWPLMPVVDVVIIFSSAVGLLVRTRALSGSSSSSNSRSRSSSCVGRKLLADFVVDIPPDLPRSLQHI